MKFLLRLGIILVSVTLSLIGFEIFLSKQPKKFQEVYPVHNFSQFNIHYGIEPIANLDYEEYGVRVKTNSYATFGPEIDKEKPIIIQLGDSFTAGPGIPYEKNYPFLLQEKLNSVQQKNFQTVILGMGGSSPLQQKFVFQRKLSELKPTYVIYELYANDPRDDYSFFYSNYMAKMMVYEKFPQWFLKTAIGDRVYTFISDQKFKQNDKTYNSKIDLVEKEPQRIWEDYTEPSLKAIKNEAERRGGKFILFNLPLGWELDNEYATKAAEPRIKMAEYVKEWSAKNNVLFIDMYDTFIASNSAQLNELYLDGDHGYHLTEKGAALTADKLFELVIKN